MREKIFPNGFSSWIETYYEIVSRMAIEMHKPKIVSKLMSDRHEAQGTGGMYELAEELTDEFENANVGREWDGDWIDIIDNFIDNKLYGK